MAEADATALSALNRTGPLFRFRDWPNPVIPLVAAGVYTIWRGDDFIYVGMAGRGLSEDGARATTENGGRKGLADRLASHASGRRSGDQFCVYVADRLVLPGLAADEIAAIGKGALSLDTKVREYVREHLAYRFTVTRDGVSAFELERAIQGGAMSPGKPILNPL